MAHVEDEESDPLPHVTLVGLPGLVPPGMLDDMPDASTLARPQLQVEERIRVYGDAEWRGRGGSR